MTKLKTLKDIEKPDEMEALVEVEKLKKEAIKWVRSFEIDIYSKMLSENDISCLVSTSQWVKCFFNLTEEDLQ